MDNRLQQAGNNGYTHDKSGFRSIWSSGGNYTLYDYAPGYRLLKTTQEASGTTFEFTHDENGQRAEKYRNGEMVEAYRWLDFIRLAGFHDGTTGFRFFYGGDNHTPYAMQCEDEATAYLYYDQIGSLRVVADESGNVIKEILYAPFGGIIKDTNPDLRIPIGFAGGLHDRDLGFVRFGWRDYDTFTSRWTAPDPMGDAGGDPDWYGYCLDDPVNGFDPLGLWVQFAPQINQVGIAVANELMDGRPGVVEFSKRLGSNAWDAIKSYPDVVFENTEDERERLAARATRYRERREEDQLLAKGKAKAKEEEEAAAKADERARELEKRRAADLASKKAAQEREGSSRAMTGVREFENRAQTAINRGDYNFGGSSSNIGARGGSYGDTSNPNGNSGYGR